jgi:hypothetical protein
LWPSIFVPEAGHHYGKVSGYSSILFVSLQNKNNQIIAFFKAQFLRQSQGDPIGRILAYSIWSLHWAFCLKIIDEAQIIRLLLPR